MLSEEMMRALRIASTSLMMDLQQVVKSDRADVEPDFSDIISSRLRVLRS